MADAAKKIVAAIVEPGVLGDEKAAQERENLKKRIEFFRDEIAKRKKSMAETLSEMQTAHKEFLAEAEAGRARIESLLQDFSVLPVPKVFNSCNGDLVPLDPASLP